jgi:hypothetical protein
MSPQAIETLIADPAAAHGARAGTVRADPIEVVRLTPELVAFISTLPRARHGRPRAASRR